MRQSKYGNNPSAFTVKDCKGKIAKDLVGFSTQNVIALWHIQKSAYQTWWHYHLQKLTCLVTNTCTIHSSDKTGLDVQLPIDKTHFNQY